jgi:hypothetical protein
MDEQTLGEEEIKSSDDEDFAPVTGDTDGTDSDTDGTDGTDGDSSDADADSSDSDS